MYFAPAQPPAGTSGTFCTQIMFENNFLSFKDIKLYNNQDQMIQ